MEPEDVLESLPSEIAATAQRLRELIQAAIPEAEERVYPGWRGFGYRHPEVGYFCGVFPSRKWVALGFEWGVLLPDPHGLLKAGDSTSKRVRYLRFVQPDEIRPKFVRQFLKAAVSLKSGTGKGGGPSPKESSGRRTSG